jgi:hypothetical protein
VESSGGFKYNYAQIDSEHLLRLDNTQTWDSDTIAQEVRTGEFSPPINEPSGEWTFSELKSLKLISNAVTEDQDITASMYVDGSISAKTLTIALNSGGTLSRDIGTLNRVNQKGFTYQIKFTASTSTDKWKPLLWGYKARYLRED